MKPIKYSSVKKEIKLGRQIFVGHLIGSLPKRFAFIYDENEDQEGIYQWFNMKGYTWIAKV